MFNKLFNLMVHNCKNFYILSVQLKRSFMAKNLNSLIMSTISLLYLGALFFSFMWIFEYSLIDMFQITIFSLFSFALSIFISDNFKFSNNKFIFLLQSFVSYTLILACLVLMG
jgi:hypothetical protein